VVCGETGKIKSQGHDAVGGISAVRRVQCRQGRWDARPGTCKGDDAAVATAAGMAEGGWYKQHTTNMD